MDCGLNSWEKKHLLRLQDPYTPPQFGRSCIAIKHPNLPKVLSLASLESNNQEVLISHFQIKGISRGQKESSFVREGAISKTASRWKQSAPKCIPSHSPAVFYKVMNNFVQDLLKQGRADPQVLDGKWGQVGQFWHLSHILLEALDLISPLRPAKKEKRCSQKRKSNRINMQIGKCPTSLRNERMAIRAHTAPREWEKS